MMKKTQISLAGYHILKIVEQTSQVTIYKAISKKDQQPVIIKLWEGKCVKNFQFLRLYYQYSIAKNLHFSGIFSPLNLHFSENKLALILPDEGLISLEQFWQEKNTSNPLESFLSIAIQLTKTLHDLHGQKIVHKNINPSNILIEPETRQIKLTNLHIASKLLKEYTPLKAPQMLEGDLAYLSPEQTGRMNRKVDYRSDFYSLGVTFYQLLTRLLPFTSNDSTELIYGHLVEQPLTPHQINNNVPEIISDIVMKLMAKNPKQRYQDALGLKYDLEQVEAMRKTSSHQIVNFKLAEKDQSDRFLISEKVYDREEQTEALLESLARVAEVSFIKLPAHQQKNNYLLTSPVMEVMLVKGSAGVGKTTLIHEIHKAILREKGYFVTGKYEQNKQHIPLGSLIAAFQNLISQLTVESEVKKLIWKNQLLEAFSGNGQVLIDILPQLQDIIGKQLPVAQLTDLPSKNRLYILWKNLIQVIATNQHPLVIFLDDLQWIDSASLEFLTFLISDRPWCNLFLIGAYRDDEISENHPLMLGIQQMRKSQISINEIMIKPLCESSVNDLVADTLNGSNKTTLSLSQLIYQKTAGNPLFIKELLTYFYEEEIIKFDYSGKEWIANISAIIDILPASETRDS